MRTDEPTGKADDVNKILDDDYPPQVDVPLCVELIARMLTRELKDPLRRGMARMNFIKNQHDIELNPDHHMGAIMHATHQGLSFELGLHMGFVMALCSRGGKGKENLQRMLADIKTEQDQPKKEKSDGPPAQT